MEKVLYITGNFIGILLLSFVCLLCVRFCFRRKIQKLSAKTRKSISTFMFFALCWLFIGVHACVVKEDAAPQVICSMICIFMFVMGMVSDIKEELQQPESEQGEGENK